MMDWWGNLFFSDSWALWLLPAVPAFAILIYYIGGRGRPVLTLSSFRYLNGIAVPGIVKWRTVLYLLRFLTLLLLIMIFARPQSRTGFKRKHGEGIDIILTIDISRSMRTMDFIPNRIEVAKQEAIRFVDERPDDRIGVVIFSGEAFTVCPLTSDHEALKILISNITINNGELEQGTAIGMGLAKAVERIKESKGKSKVVVLLTDGKEESRAPIQPMDAVRIAKTFGVKVYTIGLASNNGKVLAPGSKYDWDYQDVIIDESTLIEIAETTGGKYFRATDTKKLNLIYEEINALEKTEFDKNGTEERQEEFLPFLLAALFLVLLEFILRYTTFDSLT